MRRGKSTRALALMLSFVMITSVFVGNTLSRYITSVSSTDSARVAVWGINGEEITMELFNTSYDLSGKKIAESNLNDDGVTRDKIIAPGTGGQSAFSIINYEDNVIPPEVAYQVIIDLDDSQVDSKIVNNTSIQWKLDNNSWGTFDELKTSLLNLSGDSSGIYTCAPGEFAEKFKNEIEHKIYWQWVMDGNNEVDTKMGNDALVSDIGVKITVSITAQQTDDLITVGILDGANQVINIDDIQPAVFRSAAPKADLKEIKVDGETVDPSNYDVTEGSTIITFHKDYLETLEKGNYIIEIVSKEMTAKTKFYISEAPIVHKDIIPEGGVYYVGIPITKGEYDYEDDYYNYGVYDGYVEKYEVGDDFPEPQTGDVYVYRDYEYRYNIKGYGGRWILNESQDGWGVVARNTNKDKYGEIITTIGNSDVVNMDFTFFECNKMVSAPKVPNTITSMSNAFMICTSLVEGPKIIPGSVKTLSMAFNGCEELIKAPILSKGVIDMNGAFGNCTSLIDAPVIPDGVVNISHIFMNCSSLLNVPIIPNSVVDMSGAFLMCASLKEVPEIPYGVTNMSNTFGGCTSLVNAPVIPSSVINMTGTFEGCTSLTGTIEINGNPTSYSNALKGTQITWIDGSISNDLKQKIAESNGITLERPATVIDGGDTSKIGVYYVGVMSKNVGDYSNASTIYINGAKPDVVQTGDVYVYGDYEYRYNMKFNASNWDTDSSQNGWGVRVVDTTKTEYDEILSSINGQDVNSMNFAFFDCGKMITSPIIPNTIVNMGNAFVLCSSLTTAPIIPENVDNIGWMFVGSSNVSGSFEVNSNPSYYDGAISGTQITEVTGFTTLKAEIFATK